MRLFEFGAACLAATMAIASHGASADDLVRNVRIVDVEAGSVGDPQDILIREGTIVSLSPAGGAAPPDAVVHDAGGGFAIPGLWDAHVHVFSSPDEYRTAFRLYLINGITGIRDMGGLLSLADQVAIARQVEDGSFAGPQVILSGAWIDAPPGSWPGMFLAATPEEGRARVNEIAGQNWAAAKSYSMLSEDTYRAIADEAKRLGVRLVGHIPESVTLAAAIEAGQNGMEHFGRVTKACSTEEAAMTARVAAALEADDPRSAMIAEMATHNRIVLETWDRVRCEQVTDAMAAAGLHVTPTLVVADFYVGTRPEADDIRMTTLPSAVREAWAEPDFRLDAMTDEIRDLADESIALDRRTFRLAHDAGVPMIAGSDASFANPFIFHGFSLLDELDRYVGAGLTPREALYTATVAPPRFLDLPHQDGAVAAGRRADIVILAANPLLDLSALRNPDMVIAGGRVFDRAALDGITQDLLDEAGR